MWGEHYCRGAYSWAWGSTTRLYYSDSVGLLYLDLGGVCRVVELQDQNLALLLYYIQSYAKKKIKHKI